MAARARALCSWPDDENEYNWYGSHGILLRLGGEVNGHPCSDVPGFYSNRCHLYGASYRQVGGTYTAAEPEPWATPGYDEEFGVEDVSTGVKVWDKQPQP